MVYSRPTNPETVEDKRLYTEERLTEVGCLDCNVHVRVKKNSEHHTSVQWGDGENGPGGCPVFRRMAQQPGGRHVYATCPQLENSIDSAVRDGVIEIGAIDGY